MSGLGARKSEHLSLCADGDVEHRGTSLLEQVHLVHDSLPELSYAEIDLSVPLLGRQLLAPVLISGMTGGTAEARELNRHLAELAQKYGFGMGVGSQRAMLLDPALADTYRVRDVAPDVLLLANLGAVQARDCGPERVAALVDAIGADALCIHLNPAQELVQDEGDRDFRGCLAAIAEVAESLPLPVVVKETGCGLGPRTLARLAQVGVTWVDVSGAGGTSWTAVEALRGTARQRELGRELREWGIPTAAAVVYARRAGLRVIASGGVRGAVDAARALALGAEAVSLALPWLRAWAEGGSEGLRLAAERLIEGLRSACLLTGCRQVAALAHAPRVLGAELRGWIEAR